MYIKLLLQVWRGCKLRVIAVAQERDNNTKLQGDLQKYVYQLRVDAEILVCQCYHFHLFYFSSFYCKLSLGCWIGRSRDIKNSFWAHTLNGRTYEIVSWNKHDNKITHSVTTTSKNNGIAFTQKPLSITDSSFFILRFLHNKIIKSSVSNICFRSKHWYCVDKCIEDTVCKVFKNSLFLKAQKTLLGTSSK